MEGRICQWGDAKQDAVVCDLGGNNGHAMLDLVKVFPHMKTVVQDLGTVQPLWEEVSYIMSARFTISTIIVISYGLRSARISCSKAVLSSSPSTFSRTPQLKAAITIIFAKLCRPSLCSDTELCS